MSNDGATFRSQVRGTDTPSFTRYSLLHQETGDFAQRNCVLRRKGPHRRVMIQGDAATSTEYPGGPRPTTGSQGFCLCPSASFIKQRR